MASIFNRIALLFVLVVGGCNLFDKDKEEWSPPGFIFRCADERGCGFDDEEGVGDGVPVIVGRDFNIYYGSTRLSESDGGDLSESMRTDDDVHVFSASSELITGRPFQAMRPGECAVIAANELGKVIDYTFVSARYGSDDDDNDEDDDDTGHRDAGADTGEALDDPDTDPDGGVSYEDSNRTDTDHPGETDSDSAFPLDTDVRDEVWDGGVDGGDGVPPDTESETLFDSDTLDSDTDETISTMDGGMDTDIQSDAGVRSADSTDEERRGTR